jgi:hypothetical protein
LYATYFEEESSPETSQALPGTRKRDPLPQPDAFWEDDGDFGCHAGAIDKARFLGRKKAWEDMIGKL